MPRVKAVTDTSKTTGAAKPKAGEPSSARKAAKAKLSTTKRSGLILSVARTRKQQKTMTSAPISVVASLYQASSVEYILAEILELAGNIARDKKRTRVTPNDIAQAIRGDEELYQFLGKGEFFDTSMPLQIRAELLTSKKSKKKSKKAAVASE